MNRADIVAGAVLVILAIVYLVSAAQIPESASTGDVVSPSTFPMVIGGALLVVSLGVLITQLLRARKGTAPQQHTAQPDADVSEEASGSDAEGTSAPESSIYGPVLILVATIVYLMLLGVLGFVIPTAIYIAAGVLIVGGLERYRGRRLAVPAGFGVVAAVTMYVGFALLLNVPLPEGVVGF